MSLRRGKAATARQPKREQKRGHSILRSPYLLTLIALLFLVSMSPLDRTAAVAQDEAFSLATPEAPEPTAKATDTPAPTEVAPAATPEPTATPSSTAEPSGTPEAEEEVEISSDMGMLAVCQPTVSASALSFAPSVRIDSNTYAETYGQLAIVLGTQGGDCSGIEAGWAIQLTASPLANLENNTLAIPPASITYLGTAPETTTPNGILPAASFDLSIGPHAIATTTETETTDGIWTIELSLTPPGSLPAGSYRGTITVTVASGPT